MAGRMSVLLARTAILSEIVQGVCTSGQALGNALRLRDNEGMRARLSSLRRGNGEPSHAVSEHCKRISSAAAVKLGSKTRQREFACWQWERRFVSCFEQQRHCTGSKLHPTEVQAPKPYSEWATGVDHVSAHGRDPQPRPEVQLEDPGSSI